MKISAINNFIYLTQTREKHSFVSKPLEYDTFIKTPSFKGKDYNLISPFLTDGISYTAKNLNKFNEILNSTKENLDLYRRLSKIAVLNLEKKDGKDRTFALDFLTRAPEPWFFRGIDKEAIYTFLPKIKFAEEAKPNILILLKYLRETASEEDSLHPYKLFSDSLKEENIPLLRTMIVDDNWNSFIFHQIHTPLFKEEQLPIIRQGQNSDNPQIKELFNNKNLYNLLIQYQNPYTTVLTNADSMFDLGMIFLYETPSDSFQERLEHMSSAIISNGSQDRAEYLSEIPISNFELSVLNNSSNMIRYEKDVVRRAVNRRVEKIIERYGIETPGKIFACLNDRIMASVLLTEPYKNLTLLEKIVTIPPTKENEHVISQIIEKLSEIKYIPDNQNFRQAAIDAARNGNIELLKFFEKMHIHFANILNEPLENFPAEAREILKQGKINNPEIFAYAEFPQYLTKYLQNNPQIDINSTNENGETILNQALSKHSLELLQILAKRDDVDWNVINSKGDDILMQLFSGNHSIDFMVDVMQLLQELPEGKFDINHIKPTPLQKYTPLSLLHCLYRKSRNRYKLFDEILKFPDIDTNLTKLNSTPFLLKLVDDIDLFKKIYKHPNTDLSLIKIENIEKLKTNNIHIDSNVLDFIKGEEKSNFISKFKKNYEKNGILTIDEIEEFVNDKNFMKVAYSPFNIFGENIVHLLVDIFPDTNNPEELNKIIKIFTMLKNIILITT